MNTLEKLKAILEMGYSQHEIKRESGISQASISRIVGGKQGDTKASTVEAINSLYRKAKRRAAAG